MVCGKFVGGVASLSVVSGWFVGGLDGLWVVSSFTANAFLQCSFRKFCLKIFLKSFF